MSTAKSVLLSAFICAAGLVGAQDAPQQKAADVPPDISESSKLQEKMPGTVSGIVTLAGKGLEGARVTDGMDFVTTDKDGRYTITLKPDPIIPYLPSRTISVSWPSGTWPVRDDKTGRYRWWTRLMDVKDAKNVNFELGPREVTLPMCVAFGTDPHSPMSSGPFDTDIANAPGHVAFAAMGGDLGYASFNGSEDVFKGAEEYTKKFPVMLLHCVGNHDMVGKHVPWSDAQPYAGVKHTSWFGAPHESLGYGGFIKRLNPVRWSFDCAGIRFIGIDFVGVKPDGKMKNGISETAIDWLERDLASKPADAPAYLFNHQAWSPSQRFFEVCSKYGVRMCLGGDTHRNMFLYDNAPKPGAPQYWTKHGFYTLVYIDKAGFEFVDECFSHGARNGWDGEWSHDSRGCALYNDLSVGQRGEHVEVKDVTLDSKSREIKAVKGETYDLRIGAKSSGGKPAKRWGIRLTCADGKVHEFAYDEKASMLTLLGLKTPFKPALAAGLGGKQPPDPKEQEWVEMRIQMMPDRVRTIVNSRVHHQRYITPGEAKKIEIFSEDGATEFGRVDVWQRTWPKDWKGKPCANSG